MGDWLSRVARDAGDRGDNVVYLAPEAYAEATAFIRSIAGGSLSGPPLFGTRYTWDSIYLFDGAAG